MLTHASRFRTVCAVAVLATFAAVPSYAVQFTEVARFDVDFAFAADLDPDDAITDDNTQYIGTNPLGVAWDGSKLYLAGHDNFGTSLLPIGLIEVLNPAQTGVVVLGSADFSPAFGQIFQPTGRGYTSLELDGGNLAASYDNGSNTANAIQLFDTSTNSLSWDLSAAGITGRGGSGVAFDPGFNGAGGAGAGVAWTTFGSGRRALQNTATGATLFSLTDPPGPQGYQWLTDSGPAGNFARDMTFDPDTGDIYVRRSNDVDAAERDGDNSTTMRQTIVDNGSNGNFILGHKIEFMDTTADGDLLIYNDSDTAAGGRSFDDIVKVIDTAGVAQTATFTLLNGDSFDTTSGIYDFDFDAGSQTLALADFTNRNVHIFEVGAPSSIPGDFDGDGDVDVDDFGVFVNSFQLSPQGGPPFADGDFDEDGDVDVDDFGVFVNSFQTFPPPAVAVPEPAGAALIGLAALALGFRRER